MVANGLDEVLEFTLKAVKNGRVIYRKRPKGSAGEVPIPVMRSSIDVEKLPWIF
jgi:hypothetical protein